MFKSSRPDHFNRRKRRLSGFAGKAFFLFFKGYSSLKTAGTISILLSPKKILRPMLKPKAIVMFGA
jgi:hypothetical protein